MVTIRVVCGVIFKDGQILLCRRSQHTSLSGYWEFPGGKVEPGESDQECLSRELLEELGMRVIVGEKFKTVYHRYDGKAIELTAYLCRFVEADYILTDHDQYEWLDKTALHSKQLAPADIPIADALIAL